jgi:putative flavoprotein involved in K+ transport
VVATGPFQVPFIPPIATGLDPGVRQLHSAGYRSPATMPPGRVLVVGAANSGCQIAEELSATHRVELSADQRMPAVPQVIGGGPRQLARRHGVRIRPRATGAAGRTVRFAEGDAAEFDAVVWATGFTTDHSWIDVPGVEDERGRVLHQRGVTPAPGLYVLGLTWQHTRTSALLGWVRNDAAFLAEQIASRADGRADPGPAARTSAASPGVQAAS